MLTRISPEAVDRRGEVERASLEMPLCDVFMMRHWNVLGGERDCGCWLGEGENVQG